jgi:hypothetical protein
MPEPPGAWPPENIDKVLEFIEVFEDPVFVAFVWEPSRTAMKDGKEVRTMPYPAYHEKFDEFFREFNRTGGFIHPYRPLPEDPTQEEIPFSVLGAYFPIEYFETATVNQIRRYFSLCCRGERFCDGYKASQFENGKVLAALKRLRQLRKGMP